MDVWAAGVIMGDLFKYAGYDITKDSLISDPNAKRSLQIFRGTHCFPLSPKKVVFDTDGLPATKGDVLESIFDLIGTPDDTDISFITD